MAQKPIILALETSSRIGSVALGIGEQMLAETTFSEPLKHSAEIFPSICDLTVRFGYKPGQIEHVYLSIGPGSFTGLRIAATAAKMMYLANTVKVVTVGTLDVIAANISEHNSGEFILENHNWTAAESLPIGFVNRIATILDAKRSQFFVAMYERVQNDKDISEHSRNWEKVLPDMVMDPEHFLSKYVTKQKPVWLLGDGLVYNKDRFRKEGAFVLDQRYWSPKASNVLQLGWEKARQGQFVEPVNLTPSYLLRPDIKIKTR